MHFSTKQNRNLVDVMANVNVDSNNVEKVKTTKYFGIHFDQNLNCDNH